MVYDEFEPWLGSLVRFNEHWNSLTKFCKKLSKSCKVAFCNFATFQMLLSQHCLDVETK